jgi:hypothetical protein
MHALHFGHGSAAGLIVLIILAVVILASASRS